MCLKLLRKVRRFLNRCVSKLEHKQNLRVLEKKLAGLDCEALSYVPEEPRKPAAQIRRELLQLALSDMGAWGLEATISQYFFFKCDRFSVDVHDFVFQREYDLKRNELNGPLAPFCDFKDICSTYMQARGIRVAKRFGHVDANGILTADNGATRDLAAWLSDGEKTFFAKPNAGIQGKGCACIELKRGEDGQMLYLMNGKESSLDALTSMLKDYLLEERLLQHEAFAELSPHAFNPLRIRTLRRGQEVEVISVYINLAWKDRYVSNITNDGISYELDAEGCICSDGIVESGPHKGFCKIHPELGRPMIGFQVPFFAEAKELAIRAHKTMMPLHSIGWDIGISPDGPVVIEANPDYGTATFEMVSGKGERQFFENVFCR